MSKHPTAILLGFTGLLAGLFLAVPARALQEDEVTVRAGELVRQADRVTLPEVWGVSRQLADIVARDDVLVRAIRGAGEKAGEMGRLASAKALLELTDQGVYADQVLEILRPVWKSADAGVRAAAAALLGDSGFTARTAVRREATGLLREAVTSDTESPRVRIEAAKALFAIGEGQDRGLARNELRRFLRSTDRSLQVAGALALAAIDDVFSARPVLAEIAGEPTVEGELARTYLAREKIQREHELEVQRILRSDLRSPPDPSGRFDLLEEILHKVRAAHVRGTEFEEEDLLEAAASGMLRHVDRHSGYLTSDQYRRFYFDLSREYGGIGAYVNMVDGVFTIVRPIYAGPAYKVGLRSGDRVRSVDGWDTADRDMEEIIDRLKGKPGTPVVVSVWRPGWQEPKDITIVRDQIRVPSVHQEILPGDVGYIEVTTFGLNTADEIRRAMGELKAAGMKAMVLDLRNNTGGFLQAARDVADIFLPKGRLIVETRSRIDEPESLFSEQEPLFPDLPLVALVNSHTASAAEIVAGALQDHGRAVVVGARTFGKGSVQNLLPLRTRPGEPFKDLNRNGRWDEGEPFEDINGTGKYDPGPRIRLTVAEYFLPSGRTLHKHVAPDGELLNPDYGVMPDKTAELETEERRRPWKEAEVFDLWRREAFHDYVKKHWEEHKDLFVRLAEGDEGRHDQYPGFEEFYEGLDTQLDRDDVRRWVRVVLRDRVADLRGKAFPGTQIMGDFQEDTQFQAAIRAALEQIGRGPEDVPEFRAVFREPAGEDDAGQGGVGRR